MPTIAEQLNELVRQKKALANNLAAKGVTAKENEKLNTLVPKVLDIETGGGTDTSDATARSVDVRDGKTFYADGEKMTGVMPTISGISITPSDQDQQITGNGYLEGNITVSGDSNLLAQNIKQGIAIFGITGTYQGDGDLDTSDATATSADMKAGVTAYVDGAKITGDAYTRTSMVDAVNDGLIDGTHHYLKAGFYGAGIDFPAMETLLASNIKRGVTIYGITGTYGPVEEFPVDNSEAASAQDVYATSGESALIYIENDQIRTLNELQEYSTELKEEKQHWSTPNWGKVQDGIWGIAGYDAVNSEIWNISGRKIRYILKDKIQVDGETFTAQLVAAMAAYATTTEYRFSLVSAEDTAELKEKIDSSTYDYTTTVTPSISDVNQKQYELSWITTPGEYYLVFETTYQAQVGFVLQKLGYFMI